MSVVFYNLPVEPKLFLIPNPYSYVVNAILGYPFNKLPWLSYIPAVLWSGPKLFNYPFRDIIFLPPIVDDSCRSYCATKDDSCKRSCLEAILSCWDLIKDAPCPTYPLFIYYCFIYLPYEVYAACLWAWTCWLFALPNL